MEIFIPNENFENVSLKLFRDAFLLWFIKRASNVQTYRFWLWLYKKSCEFLLYFILTLIFPSSFLPFHFTFSVLALSFPPGATAFLTISQSKSLLFSIVNSLENCLFPLTLSAAWGLKGKIWKFMIAPSEYPIQISKAKRTWWKWKFNWKRKFLTLTYLNFMCIFILSIWSPKEHLQVLIFSVLDTSEWNTD